MNTESDWSLAQVLRVYLNRVRAFRPNARLYLFYVIASGAAFGVFRLLFNFFVLSLGYDEALLGRLITANNLTALLVALPIGYLADRIGRKCSLLISASLTSLAILGMVAWPGAAIFFLMNIVLGVSQSLSVVTTAPFLMENSGNEERTYLFSFSFGLQTLSGFAGNWIGGYLPTWIGNWNNVSPVSSTAYGGALGLIALVTFMGLIPLFLLRPTGIMRGEDKSVMAPLSYFRSHFGLLGKIILPIFVTSIGAGLIMPFMNVFFRVVHDQPDPVIGSLFAWGSLAMGLGLLIAPVLADRIGKIHVVVITQALSIPFLILLGFAPWFWLSAAAYYIRLVLMNMSNPVYQTFVMEHIEPEARATAASLTSMAWNFGWAFSPIISGWIQVEYGFGPAFAGTILTYIVAVYLYWMFFWREETRREPVTVV